MLTDTIKASFKDAAQKLSGKRKRDFIAKVTEDDFDGSARKAETILGWCRHSVQLGLHENGAPDSFVWLTIGHGDGTKVKRGCPI